MIIDTSISYKHPHHPETSTAESLLRAMDVAGVDMAVVHHFGPIANFRFEEANDELSKVVKTHPDRFVGVGTQNYYKGTAETDRCLNDLGLQGVKLFSSWGLAPGTGLVEKFFFPIAEKIQLAGSALMIEHEGHTPIIGGAVFWDNMIAKNFPHLPVVMCRCWTWAYWPDYLMTAELNENILMEFTLGPTALVKRALNELGPDRMVMGSWAPEMEPAAVVDAVRRFPLDEDDKQKILGGNAARILGLKV
jgi:predicted TIM-barrel fold metal-dependent hydrolase